MTDSGRDFVPISDEIGHPLTNERSCCPVGWREEEGGKVGVMNISIGGIEKNGVAQLAEHSLSRGFESIQVSYFSTCSSTVCLYFALPDTSVLNYYDAIVT